MDKWLFDILKDNTLVDNQVYAIDSRVLSNGRLKERINLNQRQGSQWTTTFNDDLAIWNFLFDASKEVNQLIENGNSSLVLFNSEEYEHNTDDDFYTISGRDYNNFRLTTGNLIGYVKKGDYAIKISSRFGDQFLREIIADTDGFLTLEDYGSSSESTGYEWLLVYLWKIKLKKAFRLGLPKEYVTKNERLNKVKGNINVLDYYINNTGKYLCKYREHSYNNQAVQLINRVFSLYQGHPFLQDMHHMKNTFIAATKGEKASIQQLKTTKNFRNPFYADYNKVIEMSKMLINNKSADFGEKNNSNAFFFDVSMLFEYYIKKTAIRSGFQVESKFKNPYTVVTGSLGNYTRKLEPDLVINTTHGQFVFDVKYKSYDTLYGVKREDIFQLHTYIGQYGNHTDIVGSGFIFPISEKKAKQQNLDGFIKQEIYVMGNRIPFYILFFIIPDANDSKEFIDSFKRSKLKFVEHLQSIIH